MAWWLIIAVAVALVAVQLLLRPKVKTPRPDATKDFDNPTADAGRPIPVPFGTITIKSPNCLWFGDKWVRTSKVKP